MELNQKKEILLESGTNEIEIMEFTIAGNLFGINVAKVREIMMATSVKPMPHSHPAVEGVFKPRDKVISVINLPMYLGFTEDSDRDRDLYIVTEFNKMTAAFHVHTVVGIDRISWEAIEKPDKTIYGGQDGVATGLAQCDGRLITILDFEKILAEIAPETGIQMEDLEKLGSRNRNEKPVLIAEDSPLLLKMISDSLIKAGYSNIIRTNNGREAWDFLESEKQNLSSDRDILESVSCIITDIEMPQMDGHRLTKLVKEDDVLKKVPLVIFSSLINAEMEIKGKQLGADEQLSKPEIVHLVSVIDHLMEKAEKTLVHRKK